MQQIIAFIKPMKLADVTTALHGVEELSGVSVTDVHGFGRRRGRDQAHREVEDPRDYEPHRRVEIMCNDELVDVVVETIREAARTGLRGDGKIYVAPLDLAVRISTGERGADAV